MEVLHLQPDTCKVVRSFEAYSTANTSDVGYYTFDLTICYDLRLLAVLLRVPKDIGSGGGYNVGEVCVALYE